VRVVTQNVWGKRGAWELRKAVLKAGLERLGADIVSFQEVIKTAGEDTAAELLEPGFEIAHQEVREPDGQGLAIASRWPVVAVHEISQRVTARVTDALATLAVEVAAPDPIGPVVVVNHAPSWQLDYQVERELQARAAGEFVEDLIRGRRVHVVLASDLTDAPDAASVRFWTGLQSLDGYSVSYRDAWQRVHPGEEGATYTADNPILWDWDWPLRRLDYVMVRCGRHGGPTLDIKACERLFTEPVDGVWASDHFGVMADLELPVRESPPPPNLPGPKLEL
jgi:endonuclease/exonuclease/phosphatase family metal-dependent hydrolase